ncbi:MAG TPA: phage tail protein [Polyangiaceae bacterium]|nr:phage tail protein [Polyangiaceae bacterium]
MTTAGRSFRYLNREGRWLDFHRRGLEIGTDGALRLFATPRRSPDVDESTPAPAVSAPSGVVSDARGRVFYTVPGDNQLWYKDDCESSWSRLGCVTESEGQGALREPRGMCVLERSRRLVLADSRNARLLFLDLEEFVIREVWGGAFGPQECRGLFVEPWAVGADADENVYVLDHGRQRVWKFSRSADRDALFSERLQASGLVTRPGALAVAPRAGGALVFISDLETQRIRVFDRSGQPVVDAQGAPVALCREGMGGVVALAVDADTLYVGDNTGQRLLTFRLTPGFPFAGDASGFVGPTASVARDAGEGLLAHAGGAAPPERLEAKGAFAPAGTLWSCAIRPDQLPVKWGRLRAGLAAAAPVGAHLELFYLLSNDPTPPEVDPKSDNPFEDPRWRAIPTDVTHAYVPREELLGDRVLYAFFGARFTGDRTASVALAQLRVDFDVDGYERYLPAIYREPAAEQRFLHQYLALFESVFDEIEEETAALVDYFDPHAAPASALGWLASWLATPLDQEEPIARRRASIASAYQRQKKRGTAEGMRLALLEEAGVHATISEPLMAAEPFWLPTPVECGGATALRASALGFGAHLAATEPGGAVLGSTAALDRSYLIADSQFGEPLFENAAHQFVVEVYQAEVSAPGRLERVRGIIEREKPAHTLYRLEVVESGLSVGQQARVGIDTVLGGAGAPSALGQTTEDFGIRLRGEPAPRVGHSRLGQNIRL